MMAHSGATYFSIRAPFNDYFQDTTISKAKGGANTWVEHKKKVKKFRFNVLFKDSRFRHLQS